MYYLSACAHLAIRSKVFLPKTDCTPPTPPSAPLQGGDSLSTIPLPATRCRMASEGISASSGSAYGGKGWVAALLPF